MLEHVNLVGLWDYAFDSLLDDNVKSEPSAPDGTQLAATRQLCITQDSKHLSQLIAHYYHNNPDNSEFTIQTFPVASGVAMSMVQRGEKGGPDSRYYAVHAGHYVYAQPDANQMQKLTMIRGAWFDTENYRGDFTLTKASIQPNDCFDKER